MNYILLLAIVYIFVPSCFGSSLLPSYAIGYSQSQVTSYHSQLKDITTTSNGMRGWNQRRILDSHLKHNRHRSDDGIEYNPTRFDNFTSDWQGNILNEIGDCNLKQLVLPGTHDSGAYALSSQIVDGAAGSDFLDALIRLAEFLGWPVHDAILPWALTQTDDLYDQAMGGIRYFDLRISWNGTHFLTYHFLSGNPVSTLLNDLNRFIRSHPTEVIIIEGQLHHPRSHPIPAEAKTELAKTILTIFDGVLYPQDSCFNISYRELLAANYRVLFTIDDIDIYHASQTSFGLHELWLNIGSTIWNTYANTPEVDKMIQFNTEQIELFNTNSSASIFSSSFGSVPSPPPSCRRYHQPNGCLYKLSWTLTPNATTILNSLQPNQPTSLLQLADEVDQQLDRFVSQNWIRAGRAQLGNVFIVDDYRRSDLIQIMIQQNLHQTRQRLSRDTSTSSTPIILTED